MERRTQETIDFDIRSLAGITADSRQVQSGFLFAALVGVEQDGCHYIGQALAKGATAILVGLDDDITVQIPPHVYLLRVENPRHILATMAAKFYGPAPKTMVGVTGTNGKTSIVEFTRQLWQALGVDSGSIGTLGALSQKVQIKGGLTTPDPVFLQKMLGQFGKHHINHCALEASSHGLSMYRLDGIDFEACAFTNLTRDHLDYHKTMQAYERAKLSLFERLLKPTGTCVAHVDLSFFAKLQKIACNRKQKFVSYGLDEGDIHCTSIEPHENGFLLDIKVYEQVFRVNFPLMGLFQVENALCALALVAATGFSYESIVEKIPYLKGIRGRLEKAAFWEGKTAYVDYSHTPDALAHVLQALRKHTTGRLIVVFGCGGDRDGGKRPLMGKVALDNANEVIITDDNPRSEDAATIRMQVKAGCPTALEIGNRKEAIAHALSMAQYGDIVLVAGKGHEQGQIVGDQVLPFDDVLAIKAALK